MSKHETLVASIVISIGAASTAFAGTPAWCKDAKEDGRGDLGALSSKDLRVVIPAFVAATCGKNPEADAHRAQIEAARQRWTQRLHMTEPDWADAVAWTALPQNEKMSGSVDMPRDEEHRRKRAWSSFDAIEQWAMIYNDISGSGELALDHDYFVDALGTHLSQVGRAAYVRQCVRSGSPTRWAMCQGDLAQLDLAKLGAELTANTTYGGADKMQIRIKVDELEHVEIPAEAAAIKKLVAKEPAFARLFEIADATWKEWAGRYKSEAPLLQLVAEMEDALSTNSRKLLVGCEDRTWDAWKTAVAVIPAKEFEGMKTDPLKNRYFLPLATGPILSRPSSYLASIAFVTCLIQSKASDALAGALGRGMERWPGFRGPRTATESAILSAGIVFDDPDTRLGAPGVARHFGGFGGGSGGGSGVIESLKRADNTVTITFKSEKVKEQNCAQWKDTNRLERIDETGKLIYGSYCEQYVTVVFDERPPALTVNARYMDGVKPGMFVHVSATVIETARAKPDAVTPSMVFGVALK